MRVVSEISHSDCKITIFSWNNRYILKFEQGYLEQTYKIDQYDVADEKELKNIIESHFITPVLGLFSEMNKTLHTALQGL
jgi:hypothetical protein